MKLKLAILAILAMLLPAIAAERITATITVTNAPTTNGQTLVVNGNTRTFTNAFSATGILTNGTIGGSASNVYLHVLTNGFSGPVIVTQPATNQVVLLGAVAQAMAVTAGGDWASVAYSTQTVAAATVVRVPLTVETETNRTNIASLLVTALSSYSTNAFATNATALSNYVTLSNAQTIAGNKEFTGTNAFQNSTWTNGTITNATIQGGTVTNVLLVSVRGTNTVTNWTLVSGTVTNSTNLGGVITNSGPNSFAGTNSFGVVIATNLTAATNVFLGTPQMTNGVNLGGTFQAYSNDTTQVVIGTNAYATNSSTVAIGSGATVLAATSIAIGANAYSSNGTSVAIGSSASNHAQHSFAVGANAATYAQRATAIGSFSLASNAFSFALGASSVATNTTSMAIGYQATTTEDNQIRLGTGNETVSFPGRAAFGGSLIVGSASSYALPASLVGGVFLTNGTSASADATNGVVFNAASGHWIYRTSASSEGAGQNNRVHNRAAEVVGSGTDYTLTASTAFIDFGGTDPDINTLPTAGTYLIQALVTATSAGVTGDNFIFKLYNATAAADISNSQQQFNNGTSNQKFQVVLSSIVTVTAGDRIQLYGHNGSAARGTVNSTETKLVYVRLY